MTQLSCTVDTCVNYKDGYCCLNCINVGGVNAMNSSTTCCESFLEKDSSFTNETRLPCPYSDIRCEAENCIYNLNNHCEADYIDVAGHAASEVEDTLCSTFITSDM